MFDVSFPELVLIAIVGLLVIGPKRLPEALRALGLWIGRMRRSFNRVKNEIEKEIGMDEIRRQLHNEAVMEEMKRIERDVRESVNSVGAEDPPRRRVDAPGAGEATDADPDTRPSDAAPGEAAPAAPPAVEEQAPAPRHDAADGTRHG